MKSKSEKLKELRKCILTELELVQKHQKPNVYSIYHNLRLQKDLVNDIEKRVIMGEMDISGAIYSIEKEYNINMQND